MKKFITLFIALLALFSLISCSDSNTAGNNTQNSDDSNAVENTEQNPDESGTSADSFSGSCTPFPNPDDPDNNYIDDLDLRKIVVDYMHAMANVEWRAGITLDYSSYNSRLVYNKGQKYMGMIYNNAKVDLGAFNEQLSEGDVYNGETDWFKAPGNSCSTSIEHAWQLISPTVDYAYTINMMPYYEKTGVTAVGDIDWSVYDEKNTNSIIKGNDNEVIFEAYALVKPGDAVVRHFEEGGHALMATGETVISRRQDGKIITSRSYMILTEQNNLLNNKRKLPSSWSVDEQYTFEKLLSEGYLPVSIKELQEGITENATFSISNPSGQKTFQTTGELRGDIESNYSIKTIKITLRSGSANGDIIKEKTVHPYSKTFSLKTVSDEFAIKDIASGNYYISVSTEAGLETREVFALSFAK